MFDLETGIHLHEEETVLAQLAGAVDDEFDRAGADIIHSLGGIDRGGTHGLAHIRGHARRRRFLDHLLVAALQRTVALVKMDHPAAAVAEHLDLDMTRIGDEFLDQDAIIAEAFRALALAAVQRREKVRSRLDLAHALAATTGDRLDQNRITDPAGFGGEMVRVLVFAVIAWRDRHAGFFHQGLGAVLQTHRPNRIGRRSDKDDVVGGAGVGESRVLRQKSIAGMDGIGAGDDGRLDDLLTQKIALGRRCRPQKNRLIRLAHMRRVGIGFGIDGDRADTHSLGGAHDAAGNLAAIGDQERLDHEPVIPVLRPEISHRSGTGLCAGIAQRRPARN